MGGDQDLPTGPLPEGITVGDDGVARCWWGAGDPLYRPYHDQEWGRPVAEDRRLFEKLSLEGFQAGLSWLTILRKREHFRQVFAGFDPATVAQFGIQEVERLLADPGIVRNRAKIEATINNARRYDELAAEFGSLAAYVWQYEPDPQARPPVLDHAALLQLGHSPESKAMSKDLRRRGWSFVGPTTVYAFMQAMGLVNDHLEGCDRRAPMERERHRFRRPSVAAGRDPPVGEGPGKVLTDACARGAHDRRWPWATRRRCCAGMRARPLPLLAPGRCLLRRPGGSWRCSSRWCGRSPAPVRWTRRATGAARRHSSGWRCRYSGVRLSSAMVLCPRCGGAPRVIGVWGPPPDLQPTPWPSRPCPEIETAGTGTGIGSRPRSEFTITWDDGSMLASPAHRSRPVRQGSDDHDVTGGTPPDPRSSPRGP